MKKWKKLLSLVCAFTMALSLNVTAFAAETAEVSPIETESSTESGVFGMDIVAVENQDGIAPYKTIEGNGGVSTINYMSSGKYVAWSVKPATILPYTFVGEVTVTTYSTGALKGTGLCSEFGVGTESNIVDVAGMGLRNGVVYKATLTGIATDAAGNKFVVSPDAYITFTYRK